VKTGKALLHAIVLGHVRTEDTNTKVGIFVFKPSTGVKTEFKFPVQRFGGQEYRRFVMKPHHCSFMPRSLDGWITCPLQGYTR